MPTLPSWRVLRLCLEEDGRTEKRRFPGEVTRRKARMGRASWPDPCSILHSQGICKIEKPYAGIKFLLGSSQTVPE